MASWNHGMAWTPDMAVDLHEIIVRHGGHGEAVSKLLLAARANSPILGQRAEAAFDEARPQIDHRGDAAAYRAFLADVGHILDRATGTPRPAGGDWIQDVVIDRANALGWDAAAVAAETGDEVPADHVRKFLSRTSGMGSHKLGHVLRALGLTVTPT